MRVRDWQDILADVIDGDRDPEGWRAVAGQRQRGVGEDMYLGHPAAGVFHLKTYAKTPYELQGVGTRVARKVDEDLDPLLPRRTDDDGRFAVQRPPKNEDEARSMATRLEETIKVHAEAPTTSEDFFTDLMEAVDSPAFGPMEYELSDRPDRLDDLADTFEDADELLSTELDDLIDEAGVDRGFE
ncbi:MAG: hypothetical protein R6V31_06435 [Halohasta sp.]